MSDEVSLNQQPTAEPEASEAGVSEACISEACISEACISEACISEACISEPCISGPDASGMEIQPGDTYMEGPYLVFTEQFHLRRGYCCNSGCRHCPYR